MANIRSINAHRANKEDNNYLVSPVEVLDDVKQEIESGEVACNKLFVITLNTGDDGSEYDLSFYASHLNLTEMLALLDVAKKVVLDNF